MSKMSRRKLFIGSSSESLKCFVKEFANKLKKGLPEVDVVTWDKTNWKNLKSILSNINDFKNIFYYSLFFFFPDDFLESRGHWYFSTRDNVIFEFGYFLAALGVERTFVATPKIKGMHSYFKDKNFSTQNISDLKGVIVDSYSLNMNKKKDPKDWVANYSSCLVSIKTNIAKNEEKLNNIETDERQREKRLTQQIAKIDSFLAENENDEFHINSFLTNLDIILRARSCHLDKSIKNVIEDLLIFLEQFDDILDINQLTKEQSNRKIREVWVYAKDPLEFTAGAKNNPNLKLLFETVITNIVKNSCRYIYFIDKNAKSHNYSKRISEYLENELNLTNRKLKKAKSLIEFRTLDSSYFLVNFTFHFEYGYTEPTQVFLSTFHKNKRDKDVLIRVEDDHRDRIFDEINKILKHKEKSGIKILSFGSK